MTSSDLDLVAKRFGQEESSLCAVTHDGTGFSPFELSHFPNATNIWLSECRAKVTGFRFAFVYIKLTLGVHWSLSSHHFEIFPDIIKLRGEGSSV